MTEFSTALSPLGRVSPTFGTTSDIFENFTDLRDEDMHVHLVLFQADPTNVGRIYVGDWTLDVASKVGVTYVLAYGGDSLAIDAGMGLNTIDAKEFRVGVDNEGDGVYVSIQMR